MNDIDFNIQMKNFIMERDMKQEKIKTFKSLLGKMSYFNAAEGSWSNEGVSRNETSNLLKTSALALLEVGVTREDLKEIAYGSLTTESDYLSLRTRIELDGN